LYQGMQRLYFHFYSEQLFYEEPLVLIIVGGLDILHPILSQKNPSLEIYIEIEL